MEALILLIIMGVGLIGLAVSSALLYSTYHPKQDGLNTNVAVSYTHLDVYKRQVIKQVLEDLELKVQEKQAIITIGDLPVVDAQPVQMRQLFQNLIDNALKFSKKDSKPIIKISAVAVSKNDIKYNPQLNSCLLYTSRCV